MATDSPTHEEGELDQRIRAALQNAVSALERARARRVQVQVAAALSQNDLLRLPSEAWYDQRWRMLDGILEVAVKLAETSLGQIHLLEAAGTEIHLRAHRGFRVSTLEHFERMLVGTTPNGHAMCSRQHIMIEDVAKNSSEWDPAYRSALLRAGVRAFLCSPIMASGAPLGVISVFFTAPCCATPDVCLSLDLIARELATQLAQLPSSEPPEFPQ